jgi:hypothetical protein
MGVLTLQNPHKRTIRAPVNPLDKSTIVSIFPIDLYETKVTLQPARYILPKGSFEKPSLLIVTAASWWRELDDEQPLLEIPVSSIQVADSIVRDYCNSTFMCDMNERMPGLFFVPGALDVDRLKKEHQKLLLDAQRKQNEWYKALVHMADVMWSRTNGNPLSVSDTQRMAANELGQKNKPWMTNFTTEISLSNCPACGTLVNTRYPMCQNCKTVINEEQFKKLNLKFAQ